MVDDSKPAAWPYIGVGIGCISILAGIGYAALACIAWLRFGKFPSITGLDVLRWFSIYEIDTGWIGIDRILRWALSSDIIWIMLLGGLAIFHISNFFYEVLEDSRKQTNS